MLTADFYIFAAVIFILIFLSILFFIPIDKRNLLKKKGGDLGNLSENKDWKEVSLKLERHIYNLRQEIEHLQKGARALEKELKIEKDKYAKLQEKLSQERGWQKKEEEDIERKTKEWLQQKEDLKTAEGNLEQEHRDRLRLERELEEIKTEALQANEGKRTLEIQIAKLNAQIEYYRKEMLQLREINAKLSQREEETTFIAKSEYAKLEQQLKQKDKELEALRNQLKKEIL